MLKALMARCTLLAFACSISVAAYAIADSPRQINVAAGDLVTALESLARQADLSVVYRAQQLAGLRTRGVSGNLTPRQAVTELLEGTKLHLRTDAITGAMLIEPPPANDLSGNSKDPPGAASDKAKEEKTSSSGGVRAAEADSAPPPQSSSVENDTASSYAESPQNRDQTDAVVVTGTRVRGAAPASPVITISRQDINASGYADTAALLLSLPQNSPGSLRTTNFGSNALSSISNVNAATGIDLRGLGADATLVLVDGHRLAHTGFTDAFDASSIPIGAIERVEVVADGASAIYGSEAIGGVVNFITRKNFEGLETSVLFGDSTRGGGSQEKADVLAGKTWSGGSLMLSYEGDLSHPIDAADRPFSAAAQFPTELTPSLQQHAGTVFLNQDIDSGVAVFVDALYSYRKNYQIFSQAGTDGFDAVAYVQNNPDHAYMVDGGTRFKTSPWLAVPARSVFGSGRRRSDSN